MENSKKKKIIMGGAILILIGIVILVAIIISNQIKEKKIMEVPQELPENQIQNPGTSIEQKPSNSHEKQNTNQAMNSYEVGV